MLRAVALTFSCAALALTATACGESASSGDADPASLVPAGAPIYAQAAVQPEGDRRDDALAAAGKLMRTDDPGAKLRELVNKGLAEDGSGLTWEKDFAPWLGEDAGVWATNLQRDEPSWAAIVSSKDAEAAAAALRRIKDSGDARFTKRSHGGVDYEVDDEGMAAGMVDDFVVIGTEDAFKRTADLREDGDSLADSDRYRNAIDDLEEDRLGLYYMDTKPLVELALSQDPASAAQFEQFKSFFPLDKLGPITGSFQADGDAMALDTIMTGLPEGPFRSLIELTAGGKTELMRDLPGDAWGAYAIPKLGATTKSLFSSVAGAFGGAALAAQFKQETGLDLEQDVFAWVGDAGVFVRGASEADLDGALVIESTDDGKASAAFGKLIGLIGKQAGTKAEPVRVEGAESAFSLRTPDAEKPIVLARGAGRVVAAYGEAAAAAALDPATPLGDSDVYADAKGALADGMEPALLLSMPAIIELVDAIGETDAEFEEARPYLETLGAITSAGTIDGDTIASRLAVTLK